MDPTKTTSNSGRPPAPPSPPAPPVSKGGMTTMGKFCMYWLDPSGIMATRYSVGRGGLRVSRDDNSNDNYDNDNGDSLPSPYSLLLPSSLSSSSSTSTSEEEEEVINSANNFPSPGGVKIAIDWVEELDSDWTMGGEKHLPPFELPQQQRRQRSLCRMGFLVQ